MVEILIGLGGGLLGAVLGFSGAAWLELRREALRRRAEINTLLLEMVMLEATLETAIVDGRQLRRDLTCDAWRTFHPDLANWLPTNVLKLVHLHYGDFDSIRECYAALAAPTGVPKEQGDAIVRSFWSFIFKSEKIRELIRTAESQAKSGLGWRLLGLKRLGPEDPAAFSELVASLDSGAKRFLQAKGIEPGQPVRLDPEK